MQVSGAETSDPAPSFLAGGGEMGARIRAFDWAATPLGPAARWPQGLKTAVRIMLTSRQPFWVGWGKDLTYLYNDAYRSIIGGKHPWALGRPTAEVWREIWGDIEPLLATAMGGVEGTYSEAQLLIMERNGYPEETYYTFSYSPIPDDEGKPGGIICANTDDTRRVIGERQLALLRELAARTFDARSWREACERSVEALAVDARDVTFSLLYMAEPEAGIAELVCSAGLEEGQAPACLPLERNGDWPLGAVIAEHDLRVVGDLSRRLGAAPAGAWDRPSMHAALLPVIPAGDAGPAGVLVVGLNPYRLFDDDYQGFLGLAAGQVAAAIGSAKTYEKERERAQALAELDRAKTAFFSNVSHEFRTPLTLMLGPLEDALSGELPPQDLRTNLELARRNGARLLRLVNTLLDFSRIEAGRVQASFEPVELAGLTAELVSGFRATIEKAGLFLDVRCDPLGQAVYVDRDMWEKVVLNLVSNAFKFTLQGGVHVGMAADAVARTATLTVRDTGIGIPASELPRLFDRFHRVEGAQGRSFEGSGIGLALVQELVRLHSGSIQVDSALGAGTTVTVTLPLGTAHLPPDRVQTAADGAGVSRRVEEFVQEAQRWLPDGEPLLDLAAVEDAPPSGRDGAGKRVLLADDNADMRAYVRRLLEAQGYGVSTAANGEEALRGLAERPPDLILADVMMPKVDGFGLLRAVRENPETVGIPVIMLSARAGEEAQVEGLEAGADDYLVKPFAARELLARVGANIRLAEVRRDASLALFLSENQRRTSEDRLSLAVSTGRIAVFDWDVDTDRLIIDGAFDARAGDARAVTETTVAAFLDGVHADDRELVRAAIERGVVSGEPYEASYRLKGRTRERAVMARGEMRPTADGRRRMIGAVVDVTEAAAARRALEELNASLEERVKSEVQQRIRTEEALHQAQKMEVIGQLTGGVAHDFNNLLTVIIGGLDTIRRARPDDHQRIRRAADMALQGSQRAVSLTSRLLAFSRRQPLAPRPLEPNALIRDMTQLVQGTLGEQTDLECVLGARLWRIEADQNQLASAILNLAVNARDAMPDGGKLTIETANTELDESYAATDAEVVPGQYVVISVSDTGSGMSGATLERVFEPFFTTKETGRGTGLGLSMVYGFVKQSGGHVAIYSEEGQGTSVKLYFPRYFGDGAVDEVAGRASAAGAGHEETILVVE
ncbi:MAG TPA: ATP-binding protein, partial [Caulobacteraceae bacterium]|nr:ATP-binding protein [Caulobacteraceae bacterium]